MYLNWLFPVRMEIKASAIPVHKKSNKQCLKNSQPALLLLISRKIPEGLIYSEVFSFLTENNLVSSNQSGLKTRDSCISQLLSIIYEIHWYFDDKFEVRGAFS